MQVNQKNGVVCLGGLRWCNRNEYRGLNLFFFEIHMPE